MPKVVLDTNVLISAIVYGGNPRAILEAALAGTIELAISPPIMEEFQGVLGRPQFGLTPQFVHSTVAELAALAEWVTPQKHLQLVQEDPSDNLILDCAVAAEAEYLVTGDDHLLKLKACGAVRIVSPQEFVEILQTTTKHGPDT